jgi:hypothetical protein
LSPLTEALQHLADYDEAILFKRGGAAGLAEAKIGFWTVFPVFARRSTASLYDKYHALPLNVPLRIHPVEPFETRDYLADVEGLLDRLAEHLDPQDEADRPRFTVDAKLEEAMEHKTPQFFLRNIPRLDRDPTQAPFDAVPVERKGYEAALQEARSARHEPPKLISEWMLDRVRAYRATTVRWLWDEDWSRYIGAEIKKDFKGPLWRYDPDEAASTEPDGEETT